MGATLIVQPFDLLKNRMQLLGKQGISASFPGTVKAVVHNEGFFALYNGFFSLPSLLCDFFHCNGLFL
jgi:hypothetical protein